jgi:hypothetical protein
LLALKRREPLHRRLNLGIERGHCLVDPGFCPTVM